MTHIKNNLGLFEPLQSSNITVHQHRCVIVRNRNAHCFKCAEACTSGCISFDDDELVVTPEKCIGCGTCATVCPTCALEAHNPDDRELYEACVTAMKNNAGELVIACEQQLAASEGQYDPCKVVGITCLGRVEESLLVMLARAGATSVVLAQDVCAECKLNPGSATAALVCDTAHALLTTWNKELSLSITNYLPVSVQVSQGNQTASDKDAHAKQQLPCTHDSLCESIEEPHSSLHLPDSSDIAASQKLGSAQEPHDAAKRSLFDSETSLHFQKVQADGTLPHFLTHRRCRLLKALASFGEPQDVMITTRLWGHVVIDSNACISCQMCATFCPTEAIKKFEDADGTFGVKHYPSRCVKCACCTDICPSNALTLLDDVGARELQSKASTRYEMDPRKNPLGPHQMKDSLRNLMGDFVYER